MSEWVKCTDTDGEPLFVNIEAATMIQRDGKKTTINFHGSERVKVRELPEDIIGPEVTDATVDKKPA